MRLRTILVAIFFALILGYSVVSFSYWLTLQHMLVERGWNASPLEPGGPELVVQVEVGGPASALRLDDEVIAINGQNVERSDFAMENIFRSVKTGDFYNITLRREGQLHDFTLH